MKQLSPVFCLFCLSCICFAEGSTVVERISHVSTCVWETFRADCPPNKFIVIVEALHGRMYNNSRCHFSLRPGEQPCSGDAHLFAEKQCAGRRHCSLKPTNENLKFIPGNCSIYDEKFLDIAYRCEDVYSAENENCTENQALVVTSSSGYLANIVTDENEKGSSKCPWKFQPGPNRIVQLTLLDFGVWVDRGEREKRNICRIYATIKHLGSTSQGTPDTLICAGDQREKPILTTTTNIEVAMTRERSQNLSSRVYFLIKFRIVECPDIDVPSGARIEKSETGIRVYCLENRHLYSDLRCQGGQWMPPLSLDCSIITTTSPAPVSGSSSASCSEFPHSKDVSTSNRINDNRVKVTCFDGESFEVVCVDGKWISDENKTCTKPYPDKRTTGEGSFPWEKYAVPGGLLLLAVVVVIIAVVMCRNRIADKRREKNKMSPCVENNSYFSGILMPARPMSDIYDAIDEAGIQDNGNTFEPVASCSSSSPTCAAPRSCKTLPRDEPWAGCSLQRRSDTLPVNRRLPEPHEYTTPLVRDSTYLVPKEDLGDPHFYDTVPSKGKI